MKKLVAILLLLFIASGCNKVDVTNPNLVYKKYIVVRSELKANQTFKGVTFTKTLPMDEAYDIKKAELKDVKAYLKINGFIIIPLHYTDNGIYLPLHNITISAGDTYELFAEENNTSIYGKTTVPDRPSINSGVLTDKRYIEAGIRPDPNEAYGAVWVILNPSTNIQEGSADDFETIISSGPTNPPSINVRTIDLPDKYQSPVYGNSLYVQVVAFDLQFQAYFNSRNNNQPISNSFVQGGGQVVWNVYGNDVIGLFMGMNSSSYVKVH